VYSVLSLLLALLSSSELNAGPLKTMSAKLTSRTQANPASLVHDKWAVVVGIEDFDDPHLTPMRLAERSAEEFSRQLIDQNIGRFAPDHVITLKGSKATKEKIEDAVSKSWLIKKALPNDFLILYFCSRVIASSDGKDVYLCAFDTQPTKLEDSGIALKELLSELKRRTQSKFVICLLDTSAYSRAGEKGRFIDVQTLSKESDVSILSAGALGGQSLESPQADGSLFVRALCDALQSTGGMMPLQMVSEFVALQVGEQVVKLARGEQNPVLATPSEDKEVVELAAGMPVKSSVPAKKIVIGHPVDNLMLNRPDLHAARTQPAQPSAVEEDDSEDDDQPPANVDFGRYMSKMKHDIKQKWQPPKGFENRHVVATFTILRDGKIVSPEIIESSGVDSADKAALEALKNASPLDPLPLGAPKSVQIRYQFDWKVSSN
jgi:TonB family protein